MERRKQGIVVVTRRQGNICIYVHIYSSIRLYLDTYINAEKTRFNVACGRTKSIGGWL
jgi:hypothetical protein